MAKKKRAVVTPGMRERLRRNRDGKLTTEQWKDMVTEPLMMLMVFSIPLAPVLVFLGPRLLALTVRGLWFILLVAFFTLFMPLIFRARRYARAALHFETIFAASDFHPATFWMFWRRPVFYTEAGTRITFKKRLAPYMRLERGGAYIAYYLEEPDSKVLLSMAPADHPDVEKWEPTEAFHKRFGRRA